MLLAFRMASAAEVEERIAHCAARATPEARITCLERELRALAGAPLAAEALSAPDAEAAAPPPREEPEAAVNADEPALATASGPPSRALEPPAGTGEEPVVTGSVPAVSAAPPPTVELGAEQVEARAGEEDTPRIRAEVVDFRFVGYRRLLVQLDNGQVWRQIDGDRESVERGLRDADTFEVEMWSTRLGGYRMHIVPLGRTLRVERLR